MHVNLMTALNFWKMNLPWLFETSSYDPSLHMVNTHIFSKIIWNLIFVDKCCGYLPFIQQHCLSKLILHGYKVDCCFSRPTGCWHKPIFCLQPLDLDWDLPHRPLTPSRLTDTNDGAFTFRSSRIGPSILSRSQLAYKRGYLVKKGKTGDKHKDRQSLHIEKDTDIQSSAWFILYLIETS